MTSTSIYRTFAVRCRDVASALLGALWIGRDSDEVAGQIAALPPRTQTWLTAGTLALLALTSFFAAQFGLIGLAAFWLAIIVLIA